MSKYSKILNLDSGSLTTLSDVYFGYAGALIKTEDKRYYPYIASYYTISAIFKSIIKPGSGTESFQKAADYYKLEGNNYWVICSMCAYDIDKVSLFANQTKENVQLDKSLLENILAQAIFDENIKQAPNLSNPLIPIGRLNIPAKIYVDALDDVLHIKSNSSKNKFSFENVSAFLKRSSESIYLLKEDLFHWQNLYGNFVPIEPEIIGFCIAICRQLQKLDISVSQVLEQIKIDPIAELPLLIANDIKNRY